MLSSHIASSNHINHTTTSNNHNHTTNNTTTNNNNNTTTSSSSTSKQARQQQQQQPGIDCSSCLVDTLSKRGTTATAQDTVMRSSSSRSSSSNHSTGGTTVRRGDDECTCSDKNGPAAVAVQQQPPVAKAKSVHKRDMATSPNLGPKTDPKVMMAKQASYNSSTTPKSPVKSHNTRSVSASAPTKQPRPALSPIRIDALDELPGSPLLPGDQSTRSLRNARSLSPRPPNVRQHHHQPPHAITVKISAVDVPISMDEQAGRTKRCQSEHASPNVFQDRNFLYEDDKVVATSRSTGCLVYVPSDPWLRMSDEDLAVIHSKNRKKKKKQLPPTVKSAGAHSASDSPQFLFPSAGKSKSRPNMLVDDYDDPWVWKGGVEGRPNAGGGSAVALASNEPKPTTTTKMKPHRLSRQAKSLQSKELSTEKELLYSPQLGVITGMATTMSTGDVRGGAGGGGGGGRSKGPLVSSSITNVSSSLQVTVNLQPRHSFSSTQSRRPDDELQLNIRRLSEQVRHSSASRSPMGSMAFTRGHLMGTGGVGGEYDIASTWGLGRDEREPVVVVEGEEGSLMMMMTAAEEALLETTC